MKNIKWLVFILILTCAALSFLTCENPIMEKWWGDDDERETIIISVPSDPPIVVPRPPPPPPPIVVPGPPGPAPDPIYVFATEKVVQVIKEIEYITLITPEVIPSESMHEHLQIVNIDFIIFSGNQSLYNEGPIPLTGTNLSATEKARNDSIIQLMAQTIHDNYLRYLGSTDSTHPNFPILPTQPDYLRFPFFLILHGHANPVDFSPGEISELAALSLARAKSVEEQLHLLFTNTHPRLPGTVIHPSVVPSDLFKLITTEGYGGGMTINNPNEPVYTALNRRVEMILFTLTEEPIIHPGGQW